MCKLYPYLILVFFLAPLYHNHAIAQIDWGDAPDTQYPTKSANNGANHNIGGGLYLGNSVDAESDGLSSLLCDGDDNNGVMDDEDGVIFSSWLIPGQNTTIVVNAAAPGYLDAWIDFNTNNSWTDTIDQIFSSQFLTVGTNVLSFYVPDSSVTGLFSYARFRVSVVGGLSPVGNAPDGEVEDYMVYLGAPSLEDTIMDIDASASSTQNEISMTYEPKSGHILSAYNDNPFPGGFGIGVSYSSDNGSTWNSTQLPIPINPYSGVLMLDCFDPSITHNDSGHVFVAHIATDNNWATGPVSGLYVHKSTDGGITWKAAKTVDYDSTSQSSPDPGYRFNDRCQVRADKHSSSPYYNNIYIAWIKDHGWNMPAPYSDIYVTSSSDGGNSFSPTVQINDTVNKMGNMPVHDIAANGDLYVLWMDYDVTTGGKGILMLDKSTDGGTTWGSDKIVDTIDLPPIYLNNSTDVRAKGAAVLRTHPTNSNVLYITYAADADTANDGDEADIFFIKSTDGGVSWSTPFKVNDDNSFSDQVLPWMEVKANGTIDIVWYDRRNDTLDLVWDVYGATSTNAGTSFSTNIKVNSKSFSTPQTSVGAWFGEYLGLAITNKKAFVGFTSSIFDSKGDVFFSSFNNPPISSFIQEYGLENDINIYPNPTKNAIYIDYKIYDSNVDFSIFNHLGKKVDVPIRPGQISTIDFSNISAGIYIIRIKTSDSVIVRKVIKQ